MRSLTGMLNGNGRWAVCRPLEKAPIGRGSDRLLLPSNTVPGLKRHLSPRPLLPHLANQRVQLAHIEIGLSIVLPAQLKEGESVLVGTQSHRRLPWLK